MGGPRPGAQPAAPRIGPNLFYVQAAWSLAHYPCSGLSTVAPDLTRLHWKLQSAWEIALLECVVYVKTRWMRSTSWGRRTSSSPNITRQVYAALEAAKCMGDSLHKTRWMRSTSWGRRTSSSPDITRQVFDRQHAAQALHMDWIGWTPTLDACAGADDVYPHVWTSQH
jgi:hypothetical protein